MWENNTHDVDDHELSKALSLDKNPGKIDQSEVSLFI